MKHIFWSGLDFRTVIQVLLHGHVDVRFCVADNFIRERCEESVDKVAGWIRHSGYDLTKPLRVEIGIAAGSLAFFAEDGCIPATAPGIEVGFRVVDGAHRLRACLQLQGS
jgi:hypothetical protein